MALYGSTNSVLFVSHFSQRNVINILYRLTEGKKKKENISPEPQDSTETRMTDTGVNTIWGQPLNMSWGCDTLHFSLFEDYGVCLTISFGLTDPDVATQLFEH